MDYGTEKEIKCFVLKFKPILFDLLYYIMKHYITTSIQCECYHPSTNSNIYISICNLMNISLSKEENIKMIDLFETLHQVRDNKNISCCSEVFSFLLN